MRANPAFFSRPPTGQLTLRVAPVVASWDRTGSAGQRRLAVFLEHATDLVHGQIGSTADPLALRLDVGLAADSRLLVSNDLDNYLLPLTRALTAHTGRQFASVWATKRHAATSHLTVCRAAVATAEPDATYSFDVSVSASSQLPAYKEAIRDQITTSTPLTGGAIALQLAFAVGPARAWPNLWKPTIDALGAILGRDSDAGEWNTRDGRITDLGLHCTVDPSIGHTVTIAIRAGSPSST